MNLPRLTLADAYPYPHPIANSQRAISDEQREGVPIPLHGRPGGGPMIPASALHSRWVLRMAPPAAPPAPRNSSLPVSFFFSFFWGVGLPPNLLAHSLTSCNNGRHVIIRKEQLITVFFF
jgi:hypothetical protein